ncbi:MAG: hypothetical protein GX444_21495 [Myxococcales bacterium]|nr:hypothetical protein [Myxococcales bacterium]
MPKIERLDITQLMVHIGQTPVVNSTPTQAVSADSGNTKSSDFASTLESIQNSERASTVKDSPAEQSVAKTDGQQTAETAKDQNNQVDTSVTAKPEGEAQSTEQTAAKPVEAQSASELTQSVTPVATTTEEMAPAVMGQFTSESDNQGITVQTVAQSMTAQTGEGIVEDVPITLLGLQSEVTETPTAAPIKPISIGQSTADNSLVPQIDGQALPTAAEASAKPTANPNPTVQTPAVPIAPEVDRSLETTVSWMTAQANANGVAREIPAPHAFGETPSVQAIRESVETVAPTAQANLNEQQGTTYQPTIRKSFTQQRQGVAASYRKEALAAYRSVGVSAVSTETKPKVETAQPTVDQSLRSDSSGQATEAEKTMERRPRTADYQSNEPKAAVAADDSAAPANKAMDAQPAIGEREVSQPTNGTASPVTPVSTVSLKETPTVQQAASTPPATVSTETMTARIERLRDLVSITGRTIASKAAAGGGSIRLQLEPPQLGQMKLDIQVDKDGVRAAAVVESSQVKQVLLDNLPQLRQMFNEKGMDLQRFDVFQQLPNQQPGRDLMSGSRSFADPRPGSQAGSESTSRSAQSQVGHAAIYALRGMSGNIRVRA